MSKDLVNEVIAQSLEDLRHSRELLLEEVDRRIEKAVNKAQVEVIEEINSQRGTAVKGVTVNLDLNLDGGDEVKSEIQEITEELKKASYYANELAEALNRISVDPDSRNYIPTVPSGEHDI